MGSSPPTHTPSAGEDAQRRARFLRRALGLFTALLILLGLTGLGLILEGAKRNERDLERYLVSSGEGIATVLPPEDYYWFFPLLYDDESETIVEAQLAFAKTTPAWDRLERALRALRSREFIAGAAILSIHGELLIVTNPEEPPVIPEDGELFAIAAGGETASSAPRLGERFKRVYVPLREEDGDVVAVLRLIAPRDYIGPLRQSVRRSVITFAAAMVLLGVIWLALLRLLRRAVEAEQAAARSDRLRALGTLTAGIAHELRNPLGILLLEVEDLRSVAKGAPDAMKPELLRGMENLESEVRRLSALTDQFLAYSRPEAAGDAAPLELGEATEHLVKLYRHGLDADRRRVEIIVPKQPVVAAFTEDALRQVLLNLLRNADECFGDRSGMIRVTVEDHPPRITVEDDGPGMTAEVAAQVFDPFFTTRAEGTGLGLATCRTLVENAGGRITVDTASGKGSRFVVVLRGA